MTNREKLINRAVSGVAHKRIKTSLTTKEIKGETITYKFGDTKDILESAQVGKRSAMIRAAIHYANEAGALGEFKNYDK